jgi:hypothetical protein
MKINTTVATDIGLSLFIVCAIVVLLAVGAAALINGVGGSHAVPPISTSLTFSQTNRLAVTHYIIIPTTHFDWSAMTSRYPANVTRTTLRFE